MHAAPNGRTVRIPSGQGLHRLYKSPWSPPFSSTPPKSPFLASCELLLVSFWIHLAPFFLFAHYSHILESCLQCRVRQRIEGDREAIKVKIMDRPVIAERNVIHSDIMVAPLNSIHDTIQTYHWGGIFTPVPVLSTPGLSNFSMPTSRWCRTMTTGWYFSPPLEAISSLLIPRSSVTSSECLFSSYLAVLIMK
jgi:hypothetical protein